MCLWRQKIEDLQGRPTRKWEKRELKKGVLQIRRSDKKRGGSFIKPDWLHWSCACGFLFTLVRKILNNDAGATPPTALAAQPHSRRSRTDDSGELKLSSINSLSCPTRCNSCITLRPVYDDMLHVVMHQLTHGLTHSFTNELTPSRTHAQDPGTLRAIYAIAYKTHLQRTSRSLRLNLIVTKMQCEEKKGTTTNQITRQLKKTKNTNKLRAGLKIKRSHFSFELWQVDFSYNAVW